MIQVVEFDWPSFENFARRRVLPDMPGSVTVIGVADGGLPLARRMHELLTNGARPQPGYVELSCRRPSTKVKKKSPIRESLLRGLFRILPRQILDALRRVEHHRLSERRELEQERQITCDTSIQGDVDCILVVDDAVDSGSSLLQIHKYLTQEEGIPSGRIRFLTGAVTQKSPYIQPDYYWSSGVLVRFPWSLDG
jgi:hypothetical protein